MLFSFAEEMIFMLFPPKAVSKYFNKIRTGYKFVGPELDNAGITITPEPSSDNWFLAKKKRSCVSQKVNRGLVCDALSRFRIWNTEWELHPVVLQAITLIWDRP
jgi:hypothetical protein